MAGRSWTRLWLTMGGLLALIALTFPAAAGAKVKDDSGLYVPKPNPDARAQITDLHQRGAKADAELIESLIETPQAVWFTRGTPDEVSRSVEATVRRAKGTVPVLVAYNIPFRDCAQFSAGGATNSTEYLAWVDGFAAGIGDSEAIVILEPDGLGIIPWYTPVGGAGPEWCQPAEADPETAADERFAMLNAAIERLNEQPNVSVYLDGTHSAWLNVGDNASRLIRAGVANAAGFYLNVSNYQFSPNLVQYGTWISKCIAMGPGAECPNQYWNGGPLPSKIAQLLGEWTGVALSNYGVWSDESDDPALNTSGINLRYAGVEGITHFVIDTSRDGLGPWAPPAGVYPDAQDWCNPPDRGAGLRPTLDTDNALVDAYLWVKIPGESDGECTRGLGPTGTEDPEWDQVDPAAGQWFPDMALQLARNAVPAL